MSLQKGYLTVAVDEEHEDSKAASFSAPIAAIRPALPGPLFTWGDSSFGRLGHNNDAFASVPCTIKASNMHLEPEMQVRSVAMGRDFMVFCTLSGKVFTCGHGSLGQLGLKGTHTTENRIVHIDGFAFPVTQVVCGNDHSLALQENGSVYCWGVGSYGVLGLGGDSNMKEPTLIPTLDRKAIVYLSSGAHHCCALAAGGELWTWGQGLQGQLGLGSQAQAVHPTVVSKFAGKVVNAVRCGELHTLVVVEGSHLFATGNNLHGQLGFGDVKCRMSYQQVPADSFNGVESLKISDVACGSNFSIVSFVTGQVFAAGDASLAEYATWRSFQRISNETGQSALPDSLFALHAAGFTAFVTSRDGEVFMFSLNDMRSSFGGKKAILQPFHAIRGASFVTGCSFGYAAIGSAALGMSESAVVRIFDAAESPEVVVPSEGSSIKQLILPPPVPIPPPAAEELDTREDVAHRIIPPSCPGQDMYTWGKGEDGRLGHGAVYVESQKSILAPQKVSAMSKFSVSCISAGEKFTACVTDTGLLYTWGSNASFQLGLDAATTALNVTKFPDIVPIPQCVDMLKRQPVVQVACGWEHAISLSQDGAVHTWGSNAFGQLGFKYAQMPDYEIFKSSAEVKYETEQDPFVMAAAERRQVSRPIKNIVLSSKNVKQVCCGAFHSLALTQKFNPRETTELYSFGKGWQGQLGQGDFQSLESKFHTSSYPALIPFFHSDSIVLSKVYASECNSGALDTFGNVYLWGFNEKAQGAMDPSQKFIGEPHLVTFFIRKGIIDVALGSDHGLALDSNGVVYAWGSNSHGQLGLGRHVTQLASPEKVVRALYLSERIGDLPRVVKDVVSGQDQICPKIVRIAAGMQFSAMLSCEPEDPPLEKPLPYEEDYRYPLVQNRCYTFGSGKGGKAGLADKSNVYLPTRIDFRSDGDNFVDVKEIAIGVNHLVAITFADPQSVIESDLHGELHTIMENAKPAVAADDVGLGGGCNEYLETKESELSKWLDKFGLPMYKDDLIKHDIFLKSLMEMNEDDLRDAFPSIGARRRLMIAVAKQRLGDTLVSILENEKPELMDEDVADAKISTHKKIASIIVHNSSVAQLEALGATPSALAAKIHETIALLGFEEQLMSTVGNWIEADVKRRTGMKERDKKKDPNFKRDLDFLQKPQKPPLKTQISSMILQQCSLQLLMKLLDESAHGKAVMAAAVEKGEVDITQRIKNAIILLNSEPGTPEAAECSALVSVDWIQPSPLFTVSQNKKFYFVQWQEPAAAVEVVGAKKKEEDPSRKELVFRALAARSLKSFFRTSLVKESKDKPKQLERKIPETTLYTFGVSVFGELGQGFKNSHATPNPVKSFYNSHVVQVSCGDVHSLALTTDGAVFSWGSNSFGQLGLTSDLEQRSKCAYAPEKILSLALFQVKRISCGRNHNVVLTTQGPVLAWGQGTFGALGMDDPIDTDLGLPANVRLLSDSGFAVKAVECGGWHSCALLETGELYTWGYNGSGQLGLPSSVIKTSRPTHVLSQFFPEGIQDLRLNHAACGWEHTLVLGTDASSKQYVLSFGSNTYGQLGRVPFVHRGKKRDPDIAEIEFHKRKFGSDFIEQLAAGRMHSLALSSSGLIWSWGDCSVGQLGRSIVISSTDMDDAAVKARTTPDIITAVDFPKVAFISSGSMHSIAISGKGEMYAWGQGAEGQLGQSSRQMQYAPVRSETLRSFFTVACGSRFSVALSLPRIYATQLLKWKPVPPLNTSSSSTSTVIAAPAAVNRPSRHQALFAIGEGMDGQLGCESVMRCFSPHFLDLCALNVVQVAAGGKHTLLLKASGQIIAFGNGKLGQLGHGTYASSSIPVTVNPPNGGAWKQIAAGGEHSLAIYESADRSTTQLYAWGSTEFGNTADAQGDAVASNVCSPLSKSFFHAEHSSQGGKDAAVHVVAVAAGGKHSAAVDVKGKLFMWGGNENGQCGNGRFERAIQPTFVAALAACFVQAVFCGVDHTLAITRDPVQNLYSWGLNKKCQCGHPASRRKLDSPTPVPRLHDKKVVLAAAGLEHSLALVVADQSSEPYLFAFGDNTYGQLGVESQLPSDFTAVTLPNKDSAVVHIAAGGNMSCCVDSDGSLVYWGCLSEAPESAVRTPSVMQGLGNVKKACIGSCDKRGCHVIVQADVPSCDGWFPAEDIYVPPVADPSEITARPNVRKTVQNADVVEIKRGLMSKSSSASYLTSVLSWQERYFVMFSDRIDWYLNERAAVNRDLHGQFKMSRIDRPPAKVAEELRGSFGIEIVESKKPRYLWLPTEIQRDEWYSAISSAVSDFKRNSSR